MNDSLAVCPQCAARLGVDAEPGEGPATCARCRPTSPAPARAATASGSSSGEYETARPDGDGAHVEVACPDCGAALRVREKYVGRHVRCGGCRSKFLVRADASSTLAAPPAATPDPDDPWQGRAEVLRLLDEVSTLRAENDDLRAQVERLDRERETAARELARLQAQAARAGYTPRDDDVDAVTFRFLDEAARTSGA
jgi:DNA-directed RNA polymerase subunit RPC12/RpoP